MSNTVLLIRNVAPEEYGGGETYQLLLAENLSKSGMCPVIVTSSSKLLEEANRRGFRCSRAPYFRQQNWSGWRNLLFPVYFFKQMGLRRWYKRLFQNYRPKAVNIQSRDDWIAATKVAMKMNINVLWTDHMDFRSWVLENVDVWYKNLIGKWVLRCAKKVDRIILISEYEEKSFKEMVKPRCFENIVTIKNGVEDYRNDYKGIEPKRKSICYIGRIVTYKGIGELIEAFDEVCENRSDCLLNIYGDGEDYAKYKKKAERNERIRFYGRTDEPLKALAENDVFVLPSYREGLSLSLLDAAMMRKKIIASNVDGNPEVVIDGKTGLLVPPKNKEKLVNAMLYMVEHKVEAGRMAKQAREYYEENFNFTKIFAEKMLPLYNNVKEKEKK